MPNYLENLFSLKGKVAAVIGAGGFLCSEMACALAQAGVKVALLDKNEENVKKVAAKIKKQGGKVLDYTFDATLKDSHQMALDHTLEKFGCVDILVNGAGTNAPTPILDITLKEWYAVLDSQVTATLLGCQVFGKHMIKRKQGSIINISSASANPSLSKAFTYSVAKAGIKNLTQNLAREWAPYHVRVNALRPGFFPTEWSMKHFIDKKREKAILGHTPMGRYGKPRELVGAVLWLASDASGFVTGSEVAVDGGFSCMTI